MRLVYIIYSNVSALSTIVTVGVPQIILRVSVCTVHIILSCLTSFPTSSLRWYSIDTNERNENIGYIMLVLTCPHRLSFHYQNEREYTPDFMCPDIKYSNDFLA